MGKELHKEASFEFLILGAGFRRPHIHCVIRVRNRDSYNSFIRSLSGTIALKIRKSRNTEAGFALRPFTRILKWGRDFKNVLSYQVLNQMEARGLINRDRSVRTKARNKRPKGRPLVVI